MSSETREGLNMKKCDFCYSEIKDKFNQFLISDKKYNCCEEKSCLKKRNYLRDKTRLLKGFKL